MNKFSEYRSFSLRDLLNDETFISLVNKRRFDPSLLKDWKDVLMEHPSAAAVLEEAAAIIELSAGTSHHSIDFTRKNEGWNRISENIQHKQRVRTFSWKRNASVYWLRIAAIFIVVASLSAVISFYFKKQDNLVKWETALQGSRLINLPDQSKVTLGANSKLRYKEGWNKKEIREVWLTGEAKFEVKHTNTDPSYIKPEEKFIVHVGDEMNVEVLGTVFNVKHQTKKSVVELESGSVKIALANGTGEEVNLKPGEKAELDLASLQLTRFKTGKRLPDVAKDEKTIELNNTSVREIIQLLEASYHKKIEVKDSSILRRKLDGSIPVYNENDVWFILSGILDIDIEIKKDDLLVFKPR